MSGLQIKDIVKSFDGKNVLANISASIREGEFVSFSRTDSEKYTIKYDKY